MVIMHIADEHWDQDRMEKCERSASFIEAKASAVHPDLIVLAGDLQNRRQYLSGATAVNQMKDHIIALANIAPVAMVYGNAEHDPPGSLEVLQDLKTMNETYIADRPGSLWLSANGFDAAQGPLPAKALIHFLPYPTKQWYLAGKENLSIDESNEAIQQGLRGILTGFGALSSGAQCPVILVAHCNVSGSILSTGQTLLGQDIMISKHDLALAGADYVALGHIHKRQEVGPNMWYAGSTYHNNFGETEKKSLNLVTVNPPHVVTVEEVSIPSRPLSLHECTYEKGLILDENANDGDWIDADLRVRVTVAKEELELLTDEMIREKYLKAYTIQIERLVVPMERIRSTSIVRAQRLAEKVELWMKSIDKTPEPEILELANDVERSCAA